jgi:hypothetical protein
MIGDTQQPGARLSWLSPTLLADGFVPSDETPETKDTTFTTSGGYFVVKPTHNKRLISASYSFRTTFTTNTTPPLADAHAGAQARAARGSSVVDVVDVVCSKYIYIYQYLILTASYYGDTTFRLSRSSSRAGRAIVSQCLVQLEPGPAGLAAPQNRLRPTARRACRYASGSVSGGCRRSRSALVEGRGGCGCVRKGILSDVIKWRISAVSRRLVASDKTPRPAPRPAAGRLAGAAAPPAAPADRVPSCAGRSAVPRKKFGKNWEGRPRAGERSHGAH